MLYVLRGIALARDNIVNINSSGKVICTITVFRKKTACSCTVLPFLRNIFAVCNNLQVSLAYTYYHDYI